MKKILKIIVTMLTLVCLMSSTSGVEAMAASTNKPQTIRKMIHSGYKKKKRTLQRARINSRKDLQFGMELIKYYSSGSDPSMAPVDGTPTTQEELFGYLKNLYYNEDVYCVLSGDQFDKFYKQENWPYDGVFENHLPLEPFMPGIMIISGGKYEVVDENNVPVDMIDYTIIAMDYDEDDLMVIQRCREIAEAIKAEYGSYGPLECAKQLKDYLLSIAKYNKRNYDMYQLLFDGQGNCQAYTDTFDTIMKYMDIPCVTVDSVDYNHAWNIFYVGDQIYKIDVTNNWGPDLIDDTTSKIFDMDYPEAEYKILDIERSIINAELKELRYSWEDSMPIETAENGSKYISSNGKTIKLSTPTPALELPPMQPIKPATGSAITATPTPTEALTRPTTDEPTPTPTQTPTASPTPTPEPVPTDVVNLDNDAKPGTITIVDDDEANTIVKFIYKPCPVRVERIDISDTEIDIICSTIEYGFYDVSFRRQDTNWSNTGGYNNKIRIVGLYPGTTYYIKVRTGFNSNGNKEYGEWSKVYKVTTDE